MDSKKVHHHLLKISWMVFLILMSFSTAQGADRTESLFASPETAMGAADNDFRVFFNNGLNFETRDKMFKYKIGGRIMWDIGTFDADDDIEAVFGEQDPGSEFRRARIYMAGLLWNRVKFKAQYDFAGNVDFKDVYIGLTKIPYIGNFQAGHFKEPFSLEELTSSKYITFMERSLANTFSPGRNAGLAIYNMNLFDNRATAAIGLFQEVGSDPPDRLGDNGYNVTLRVTGAPIMREKGKKLAHVGFSYSYKSPED
ncbi:MAG: porin, partial [Nitrospinales bacterium]